MPSFETLTSDQLENLVYLGILGTILIGYLLVSMRGRINVMLRHAVLWALLITGVAAAYGLWDSMQYSAVAVQSAQGDGVILRRGFDGQYQLTLELTGPNGQPYPVRFIVDTGASDMVLTQADAQKLGFGPESLRYLGTARTANGLTRTAQVTLESVALGSHVSRRVRSLVNEGDLHSSLLGMGYLERFARIEIMRDRLRIVF